MGIEIQNRKLFSIGTWWIMSSGYVFNNPLLMETFHCPPGCYATDLTTGDVVTTHQYYIAYGDVTEKVSDSVSLHVCFCTVSWVCMGTGTRGSEEP